MKTGGHLKIKSMGTNVLGVVLEGNPKKTEPIHFRVVLPFGDVDIVRTTNNEYRIHTRINRPNDGDDPYRAFGKFTDARIDIIGKHAADCNAGDFKHPDMYHQAVRIAPVD
uniref:Uncharacterized protein n=1 Tax=viral metagenome TaxID=1070528 RepID=A0A6M3IMG9_9ZZZZ